MGEGLRHATGTDPDAQELRLQSTKAHSYDDDDPDAGETTLPLESPPGHALSRSAPPALDSSLV